jgi:hypothetical protein
MRPEVIELLAEELSERAAPAIASFETWDDGRKKLDGMSRGRKWDLEHESKAEKAEAQRLYQSLRWKRWYAKNKKHAAAYRRKWAAENRDKEREYARRKHRARKKNPKRWATWLARQERHKPKKRIRARVRRAAKKGP